MAATQAETQRDANVEQSPVEPNDRQLQNGTDKAIGRAPPDGVVNTKTKSPMSGEPGDTAPGHDRERPPPDQYAQYRYPEGDPYYGARPGFPGKPRPPPPQQQARFFPGQPVSQAPGPTPTLNSLLQSSGAPPHRYPNNYEQPPGAYPPGPGWPPPRPMPPYSPQGSPYRNSTPPRGYGGPPYGAGAPSGPQQPPGAYGPPGSYPQRYPPPPGAPNSRPPFSPHQGYERAGSPQPPGQPPGAPSPGAPGSAGGGMSPTHDAHMQQHHQGYPPPPRPPQPSTPNAHDPDSDLTGQNSNDSAGSGGAGRATTPHLRPTPSPTGSSGSRSMSPAVGTQNAPMPPRTSSSIEGGGVRGAAPPPAPGQGYHHPGYKPSHYAPQPPYGYPPRNHHPYPYGGYRPPPPHPPHQSHQSHQPHQPHPQHPPQHYPPPNKQQARHMGPPGPGGPGGPGGEGAMPPPTAPGDPHDNGAPPATALVTTGPDGALDEGSQQSTLSNASAASNEESCGTPKPRKEFVGAGGSPAGPAHAHDEYDAPAAWPRPPSSPVFNHIPPESYRTKKSDSLGKLYEMDDSPERRGWVERLLAFMEERRTPIAACPTISKQPLDLYRLYLLVRDRGGFVEVTKNKTWKDIAGLLGIGASSSAAYTLRKHYTKNLLAYECHFDRGGIDPQPIINQVEASTKKKSGKANNTANAGSSNSQESFPAGSPAPGAPMDGYGNQYAGYPPQQNQQQGGGPGGDNLAASNPFDEPPGPRRPQGYQQGYGYEYGSPYPPNRPVYPPYGPEGDRGYGSGGEYRYGYGYRAGAPPPPAAPPPAQPYPDYCRAPPGEYPGGKTGGPGASPGGAAGAPRRHPDFAKAEAGYSGAAAGVGAGAAGAGPRFPPAWGAAFPRPPAPPAQPATWRAPPAPQPWPPQPYQQNATGAPSAASGGAGLKRELTFPAECVEGAAPAADKRRRLTRADVAPLDAWRLVMALKCGLPAETTWALDALNVLLFDDQALPYFPLPGLPGLLDLLLELFHRALADVFDAPPEPNTPWYQPVQSESECNEAEVPPAPSPPPAPDPTARLRLLRGEDFTMQSRRRAPVVFKEAVQPPPSPPPDMPDAERVRQVLESWQASGAAPPAPHALPPPAADPRALPILRVLPGASRPTVSTTPPPAPPSAMADNLTSEPMELEPEARGSLQIRDPAGILRRRRLREYEDECYARDEPALNLLTDAQAARARRALAVSNALRSLTFVPGNEPDFARSPAYLALAGKLLLLHHEHAPRGGTRPQKDLSSAWWWEALGLLREDALVGVANVAGALELRALDEAAARPLLDGLLHWCVCGAAVAGDAGAATALSPRRLALEALCKLCVPDGNVDLLVATPPRERLPELCAALARELCRPERPVLREFAVTLLHQVAGAGGAAAHALASHAPVLQQLLGFIERAEAAALGVANQHGVAALREHPDAMGTSLDMLRRAAATLARLARHAHCRSALRRHERRLLSLVMSQILDQKVAHELADVLYHCQAPDVNSDP